MPSSSNRSAPQRPESSSRFTSSATRPEPQRPESSSRSTASFSTRSEPQRPSPAGSPRATVLPALRTEPRPPPKQVPLARPGKAAEADPRRRYPRAMLQVHARLSLADDPRHTFEAELATSNLSVGGLFLESTFFLKLGTVLLVELALPPKGRVVKVRGVVVRVETGADHSGFALRFLEYFGGSEVALASHFLAPVLREFIVAYAKQHRFAAGAEYVAHTTDVLAAWELRKAELEGDVWSLHAPTSR